jgi:hypothetical protein
MLRRVRLVLTGELPAPLRPVKRHLPAVRQLGLGQRPLPSFAERFAPQLRLAQRTRHRGQNLIADLVGTLARLKLRGLRSRLSTTAYGTSRCERATSAPADVRPALGLVGSGAEAPGAGGRRFNSA